MEGLRKGKEETRMGRRSEGKEKRRGKREIKS